MGCINRRCCSVAGWGEELLDFTGEYLGVYLGLASAFLTLPHTQAKALDHLHGIVTSSSGLWWSPLDSRLFCVPDLVVSSLPGKDA